MIWGYHHFRKPQFQDHLKAFTRGWWIFHDSQGFQSISRDVQKRKLLPQSPQSLAPNQKVSDLPLNLRFPATSLLGCALALPWFHRGTHGGRWSHFEGRIPKDVRVPSLKQTEHLKIGHAKKEMSLSKHQFSGSLAVSFREGNYLPPPMNLATSPKSFKQNLKSSDVWVPTGFRWRPRILGSAWNGKYWRKKTALFRRLTTSPFYIRVWFCSCA